MYSINILYTCLSFSGSLPKKMDAYNHANFFLNTKLYLKKLYYSKIINI